MARPAKSGSGSGRTGNSSDSIRAKRVFETSELMLLLFFNLEEL